MNRTSHGRSRVSAARGTTSSSLKPRTTTLLSLIGRRPACSAAAIPESTFSTRPPQVTAVGEGDAEIAQFAAVLVLHGPSCDDTIIAPGCGGGWPGHGHEISSS